VDLFGRVLTVEASKAEWEAVMKEIERFRLYKAEYDRAADMVSLQEINAVIEAHIEDDDVVYALVYPAAWKYLEPHVTEMGDKLKAQFEAYRDIKVRDHGYTLRDYQVEAVKTFMMRKAATVALPTGAGKTVVALEVIKRIAKRTLVLVPTRVLAKQWKERLEKFVDAGLYPDEKDADVVIATYQSFRHWSDFRDFYLVIADEGHHLPAQKWWQIAKYNIFPSRLVLTATPYRSDKNHVAILWWTVHQLYRKTYTELMEKGYLARLEIKVVWVNPRNQTRLMELESLYESLRGQDKRTARVKWQMKKLLLTDLAKVEAVRYLVGLHRDEKKIIFVPTIEAAKLYYNSLIDHRPAVLVGQGREREFPGARTIDDFRAGATKLLIATQAGEEGVDIPDASVEIMLDAPSDRQLIQRIGRVARPKPNPAVVYFVFAKGARLDIRAWKRLKISLYEAGIDVKPQHYEYVPDKNELTDPNFS